MEKENNEYVITSCYSIIKNFKLSVNLYNNQIGDKILSNLKKNCNEIYADKYIDNLGFIDNIIDIDENSLYDNNIIIDDLSAITNFIVVCNLYIFKVTVNQIVIVRVLDYMNNILFLKNNYLNVIINMDEIKNNEIKNNEIKNNEIQNNKIIIENKKIKINNVLIEKNDYVIVKIMSWAVKDEKSIISIGVLLDQVKDENLIDKYFFNKTNYII